MTYPAATLNRAAGVLVGCAVGDALGAPYEFGTAKLKGNKRPRMIGGGLGNFAPGQWTDDTDMTVCVARAASLHGNLVTDRALDAVLLNFLAWKANGPADIGGQTSSALRKKPANARAAENNSVEVSRRGNSAGNGALMRTSPVALTHLGDTIDIIAAATRVAALTHFDSDVIYSCILWSLAIDHAVRTGELNIRAGLSRTSDPDLWEARILDAETATHPSVFGRNGWTVTALQAALNAVHRTTNFTDAVERAVHAGNDTDTVAAIAGSLAGALYGLDAIPGAWAKKIHGYPGMNGEDLAALGVTLAYRAGER